MCQSTWLIVAYSHKAVKQEVKGHMSGMHGDDDEYVIPHRDASLLQILLGNFSLV